MSARGLIFDDMDSPEEVLSVINYYYFAGYLHAFKDQSGFYQEGLKFDRVLRIIYFDIELRNLCLRLIDIIERCMKTKIAYHFSHEYEYGNIAYMFSEAFDIKHRDSHQNLIEIIQNTIRKNRDIPFVAHHNMHYGGYMPIWVVIDLFTIGNLEHFFRILNLRTKNKIADNYGYGADKLESWIESLRLFRNLLAHNSRLYNRNFKYPPKTTREYPYSSFKVFDYIMVLKYLTIDSVEWATFVNDLSEMIFTYKDYVRPESIGFPEDWEYILRLGKGEKYK